MRWTAWSLPKINLSICCFEISDEVHTRSSAHCLASCLYARISVGESSTMNPTENLTIKTIAIHDVTGDLWLWLVVDLCVFFGPIIKLTTIKITPGLGPISKSPGCTPSSAKVQGPNVNPAWKHFFWLFLDWPVFFYLAQKQFRLHLALPGTP